MSRGTTYGGSWSISQNTKIAGPVSSAAELRINPTKPVSVGTLSTTTGFLASEPLVTLTLDGPRGTPPRVFAPTYGDALTEGAWSNKLDRRGQVDLVDVGGGTADELAGRDPHGKIAVMSRPWNDDGGLGTLNDDPAQGTIGRLRDAGAIAVIAFLDGEGRPGWCADVSRCSSSIGRHTPVPVLTLGPGEGAELRAAMSGGQARAHIAAKPKSDYNYALTIPDKRGVVPATPAYRVDQDALSTLRTRYHADVPGFVTEQFWPATRDGVRLLMPRFAAMPSQNTQYIGPASPDVLWERELIGQVPSDDMSDAVRAYPWDTFPRPRRDAVDYFASPAVTGSLRYPQQMIDDWSGRSGLGCEFCRGPKYFRAFGADTWSAPDQGAPFELADTERHLYREGTELTPLVPGSLAFDLSGYPDPAHYRLTLSRTAHVSALTHATRVDSDWTYTSQAPATAGPKGYQCYDDPCRTEPLLLLRYDLTGAVGLDNTVPAPGVTRFTINAYHQVGAPNPTVTRLRLWVSYDHGAHWASARTNAKGGGAFEASETHPASTTGTVSLRVQAADADVRRLPAPVGGDRCLHRGNASRSRPRPAAASRSPVMGRG